MLSKTRIFLLKLLIKLCGAKLMATVLAKLAQQIIKNLSQPMRELICTSLNAWEVKAKETESPWDDIIVELLRALFDCDTI